jgi:hypothetical protein
LRGEKIAQQSDPGELMTGSRRNELKSPAGHGVVGQNTHEIASLDLLGDVEHRNEGDSGAGQHRPLEKSHVVGG